MDGRQIMTADEVRRAIIRISHELVEKQAGTEGLVLIGIQRRGVPLARRIAAAVQENEGVALPVGALDITFYRDDLSLVAQQPVVKGTQLPVDLNDRTVVLVDDVLYTGRTVRAAMDALVDFGRPRAIRLGALLALLVAGIATTSAFALAGWIPGTWVTAAGAAGIVAGLMLGSQGRLQRAWEVQAIGLAILAAGWVASLAAAGFL